MGHFLIVLLNSDKSVKRLKGFDNRPIMNEDERAELLIAMKDVDIVVIFDEDTPERALSVIKPDYHVKGEEYSDCDIAERAVVEENGGEIVFVTMDQDISTSSIIDRIRN
jgi:rfaE bifunctional protein nucleotidyltransferase chain/domain